MNYVGIDLHKRFAVVALEDESGRMAKPQRFDCHDAGAMVRFFEQHRPFKAVVEASSGCRWFYELIEPLGEVSLAHPLRLRAIVSGRAKTDKLDAVLLARLLRAGMIPMAYVPPKPYQQLRDLTRARARITRHISEAKNELHALLARANIHSPYLTTFSKRGRRWLAALDLLHGPHRPLQRAGLHTLSVIARRCWSARQESGVPPLRWLLGTGM